MLEALDDLSIGERMWSSPQVLPRPDQTLKGPQEKLPGEASRRPAKPSIPQPPSPEALFPEHLHLSIKPQAFP